MRERLAWLSFCFAKSEGQLLRVAGPPWAGGEAGRGSAAFCCFVASPYWLSHQLPRITGMTFPVGPAQGTCSHSSHLTTEEGSALKWVIFFPGTMCQYSEKHNFCVGNRPRGWPRSGWFARQDLQWARRCGGLPPLLTSLQEVLSRETVQVNASSTVCFLLVLSPTAYSPGLFSQKASGG